MNARLTKASTQAAFTANPRGRRVIIKLKSNKIQTPYSPHVRVLTETDLLVPTSRGKKNYLEPMTCVQCSAVDPLEAGRCSVLS